MYYLIDLKSKENMQLYHSVKGRFDYKIDNKNEFIKETQEKLKCFLSDYDFVIYPESSSTFIDDILSVIDIEKLKVKKRSIKSVLMFFEKLNLQKKEKESHLERLLNMGDVFKINHMKANQRLKYENVIFEDIQIPEGRGIIVDDSYFSGTTYRGLISITGNMDFLAIFSK